MQDLAMTWRYSSAFPSFVVCLSHHLPVCRLFFFNCPAACAIDPAICSCYVIGQGLTQEGEVVVA